MNIEKTFHFLVKDYDLKYEFQEFNIGGGWIISAHSFYNSTGCFTIHSMESRGELDFYYAKQFSTDMDILYEKGINIYSAEKELWDKYGKFIFFKNYFFWLNNEKILKVATEVVKIQIAKYGEFFGVRVDKGL